MKHDAMYPPGVEYKWQGLGKPPLPNHTPGHVLLEGHRVAIKYNLHKMGSGRAVYICPRCQQRRIALYVIPNNRVVIPAIVDETWPVEETICGCRQCLKPRNSELRHLDRRWEQIRSSKKTKWANMKYKPRKPYAHLLRPPTNAEIMSD